MANIKISELTPKGANLASTDLLEISESAGGGTYTTKSITGAQIIAAAGGASGVHAWMPTSSGTTFPFSSYVSNQLNSASGTGVNYTFIMGDYFVCTPFIPANNVTLSEVAINCTTAAVGGEVKLMIFSDGGGYPQTRLLLSTGVSMTTTGFKSYTFPSNLTLNKGTTYWFAMISKTGNVAVSAISVNNLMPVSIEVGGNNYAGYDAAFVFSYATPPTTINYSDIMLSGSTSFPKLSFKIV
jgi:hypothetical protein